MAITAKFQADFSSFSDAVRKAEVELKSFETGAGRVEKSLNKMVDTFSGRKVIQDATLMAQAVERIGGTSKLTEQELQRLGSAATEAVAKMKALGLDVPANLQKIATEANKAGTALEGVAAKGAGGFRGLLSAAAPIGAALGGAFAVTSVINYAKEIVDLGGHLVDLRDKTGISVTGLQQLKAAAELSGNSLEQVTGAVSQMQNRLASGDSSAVGAVRDLGLSLQQLTTMAPDQQFRAIARSIAEIEDPAERTRIAMDLFGRSGAELLPTLVSNIDEVARSTSTMSDRTAEALDRAGDAWTHFWNATKNKTAEAAGGIIESFSSMEGALEGLQMAIGQQGLGMMNREMRHIREDADALAKSMKAPGLDIGAPFENGRDAIRRATIQIETYLEEHKKLTASRKEAAAAQKREIAETLRHMAAIEKDISSLYSVREAVRGMGEVWNDLRESVIPTTQGITVFDRKLLEMGKSTLPPFNEEMERLGRYWESFGPTLDQLGAKAQSFSDFLKKDLGKVLVGAFQGGGNVGQALGGGVAAQLFGEKGAFGKKATGFLTKTLGSTIGGALGSVIPGLGTLVGGFAGKLLGGLFGDKEHKQVNDMRDEFQATFGTFENMAKAAKAAGYEIEKLLDAKKVQDFQREMAALNESIAFQSQSMEFLNETAKKYGLTIEELGPAWQRQELDKKAQLLFKEFTALQGAQVNATALFDKMGGSASEFVQEALRTGTEIPMAMRDMLEQFAKSGDLLDENGNVIEDLEKAGLKFTMSMSEGFKSLIDEVKKLTDAISRGLGLAIKSLPSLPSYDTSGYMPDVIPMAKGGSGRVTKPTLFLAGESGAEDFAFSGGGRSFGGGGEVYIEVVSVLDGREVARSGQRVQTQELQRRKKLAAA